MSVSSKTKPKPTVYPQPGEAYGDFVWRAHYTLLPTVPNPYNRNQMVWDAWDQTNGDKVAEQAKDYFSHFGSGESYQYVRGVPCFMEHTYRRAKSEILPNGLEIPYSFGELAEMVGTQNQRCDTDAYSAISSHHTSEKKGPLVEPTVIGYAGPFRLGMLGTEKPVWAIFEDEHRNTKYSQVFNQRRRRSVEVLRPENGDKPYMDPIATLGADSPRLPLPVDRYSATSQETDVVETYAIDPDVIDRYEAAFAAPSGSNTFIPSFSEKDKDKYQEPGMTLDVSPDGIKAIVAAIMQTPQMQWVAEQMQTTNPNPGSDDMSVPGANPPTSQLPTQAPAPSQNTQRTQGPSQPMPHLNSVQAGSGHGFNQQQYSQDPGEEDEEMNVERYAALETAVQNISAENAQLKAQNAQLQQANQDIVNRYSALHESVSNMEARTVDAERTLALQNLHKEFPHMVNLEESYKECLYSQGSSMDIDGFNQYVAMVHRYAQRSPVATAMVPDGTFPAQTKASPMNQEMAKKVSKEVVHRYSQALNEGTVLSYDDIHKQVVAEFGAAS